MSRRRLVPARCCVIGELDVEAGVAAGGSIAIAVVGAQPGAFHERQPEAVQEALIMNRTSSM